MTKRIYTNETTNKQNTHKNQYIKQMCHDVHV